MNGALSPLSLAAGRTFGGPAGDRYQVVRQLGEEQQVAEFLVMEGQVARVVRISSAEDPISLSRHAQEFERRKGLLAQAAHPHLLGVIDSGQTGDGRPWIVTEYLEQGSLAGCLRRMAATGGFLSADWVRSYAYAIGQGLQKLHQVGLLHRDLCADNVMVAADGSPKLSGFEHTGPPAEGSWSMGSGYTAPEVYMGQGGPAADVFAFGALLFQLLCGVLPPQGRRPDGRPDGVVLPLAWDAVHTPYRPILKWLLKPDPNARPSNMAEVIRGLAWLPTGAQPAGRDNVAEILGLNKPAPPAPAAGGSFGSQVDGARPESEFDPATTTAEFQAFISARKEKRADVYRAALEHVRAAKTHQPEVLAEPEDPGQKDPVSVPSAGGGGAAGQANSRVWLIGGVVAFVFIAIALAFALSQ